jgi:type IV secretory pathway TrbL component
MVVWARHAASVFGVLACCVAAGAGTAAARTAANPCTELPSALRSACVAPGVQCTVHSDAHKRWETVFGTEPTMGKAQATMKRAAQAGFGPLAIEVDVRCSNGAGVYEVARARFTSHAAAAALAAQAKSKGLSGARTEDS